mgnify:CR=1 FL=1
MNAQPAFNTVFQNDISNYRENDDTISSLNARRFRVRVEIPRSAWVKELEDRFDELTSLPRGWDGYAGAPVSFNCAQFAANLIERLCVNSLPAPQLVPMPDGTVRLEWHMNQFDLEIDVLGPYNVLAYRADLLTGEEEEIEIETDFSVLSDWVSKLATYRKEFLEQAGG